MVMVGLLDIEEAYSKVWRNSLIYKMVAIGIPWKWIKVVQSWLTERSFHVIVKNSCSSQKTGPPRTPTRLAAL